VGGALALGAGTLAGCSLLGIPLPTGTTTTTSTGSTTSTTASTSSLPPLASGQCTPEDGAGTLAIAAAQAALDISGTLDAARQTYGASFAGWWIDNCGTAPVLNVMVASSSAQSRRAEERFRGRLAPHVSGTTQVHYGKYSLGQLTGYLDSIEQYANKNFTTPTNAPSSNWVMTIDPIDNAVVIELAHADARFLAQVQPLVPADALRIEWDDTSTATTSAAHSA
jgi:hypothetical protein